MAFTDYETEQLHKALLKETRHCAVTLGMKKTSVDQLTNAVGIAKGSFYKFFESKEMAFFAVLESIHPSFTGWLTRRCTEMAACQHRSARQRRFWPSAGGCLIPATWFSSKTMRSCFYRDCRRGVKKEHYHDDETHIRLLLEKYGLVPKRGFHLPPRQYADSILTVSHKEQIGGLYPQVLETLVYGACRELFK
ncbi:TetR/AcrR family transcriptional regulator [Hominenteromicrobium sp.]|uniref:TetR/AcrR family transcriptional regulator n=1 Tax=Hominenteromicrobium sp. TaxID=3073581 RepID=UPI00399B3614